MSISEHEQQTLGFIEEELAGSVPELAAKLAVFTRLTLGLLALAFVASHGASQGTCTAAGTGACRQAPAPPPGRPGAGAAGVKGW